MILREHIVSYGIYLGSTSNVIDDLQLKDIGIHDSNIQKIPKEDDSQLQLSSSFQTGKDVLKELGLNKTLTQLMMESSSGSCNHQYSMYYVKRYIEEVVRFSSQENC